ncbi:MAG TPA: DUF934 domain-containing protein [Burkholderiales bacterium]|nr:DUF934 domain-containing protein [Burkholderiales bacterium]
MAAIIKDRNVVTDPWQRLEAGSGGKLPEIPATGDIIVPLALWQAQREALLARAGRLGVWLDSNEEPAAIADDLRHFGVVAVNFPKFGDGRGYSIAHLLRARYGWKGELRAIGDIFRDQLFFLASCGFDAFVLREGEDPEEALAAFGDFSEAYQNSIERPLPLFRRRHAAASDGTTQP